MRPDNYARKQYLMQYRSAASRAEIKQEQVMELDAHIMRCTAIMSDMPKGGGSHDWTDQVDRLIKRRNDALKALKRYNDIADDIEAQIANVRPEACRMVLEARYINGWERHQTASVLHYTEDNIDKLHGRALPQITVPERTA